MQNCTVGPKIYPEVSQGRTKVAVLGKKKELGCRRLSMILSSGRSTMLDFCSISLWYSWIDSILNEPELVRDLTCNRKLMCAQGMHPALHFYSIFSL
jgi:hypothetical protein